MKRQVLVAAFALSAWLMGGCSMSTKEGGYDPSAGQGALGMRAPTVKQPTRPEGLPSLIVAIKDVTVSAADRNLEFDGEAVKRDATSRLRTALATGGPLRLAPDTNPRVDLLVSADVTLITWVDEESKDSVLANPFRKLKFTTDTTAEGYIECEIDLVFNDTTGVSVSGGDGGGRVKAQSGVRIIGLPGQEFNVENVSKVRAAPASANDIPEALRYAIEVAINKALTGIYAHFARENAG
jgi:hypothetical protein